MPREAEYLSDAELDRLTHAIITSTSRVMQRRKLLQDGAKSGNPVAAQMLRTEYHLTGRLVLGGVEVA